MGFSQGPRAIRNHECVCVAPSPASFQQSGPQCHPQSGPTSGSLAGPSAILASPFQVTDEPWQVSSSSHPQTIPIHPNRDNHMTMEVFSVFCMVGLQMPLENLVILWTCEIKESKELCEPSFMTSAPVPYTQNVAPRHSGTDLGGVSLNCIQCSLWPENSSQIPFP